MFTKSASVIHVEQQKPVSRVSHMAAGMIPCASCVGASYHRIAVVVAHMCDGGGIIVVPPASVQWVIHCYCRDVV